MNTKYFFAMLLFVASSAGAQIVSVDTHFQSRSSEYSIQNESNIDFNRPEFYVNGLQISTTENQSSQNLEATLSIRLDAATQGNFIRAGAYIEAQDLLNANREIAYTVLGQALSSAVNPTYIKLNIQTLNQSENRNLVISHFAYFIDVRRLDGEVQRLWLKDGNNNFSLNQVFENSTEYNTAAGVSYQSPSPESSIYAAKRRQN